MHPPTGTILDKYGPILTINEAAVYLLRSRSTLDRWRRENKGPTYLILTEATGQIHYFYPIVELDKFVETVLCELEIRQELKGYNYVNTRKKLKKLNNRSIIDMPRATETVQEFLARRNAMYAEIQRRKILKMRYKNDYMATQKHPVSRIPYSVPNPPFDTVPIIAPLKRSN